jgi:hypothetical protein
MAESMVGRVAASIYEKNNEQKQYR